jgi:MinD superfamily P-loop ATPase
MRQRGIKGLLIINKWDLNPPACQEIEAWASQNDLPLAGKIPFSTLIADSVAKAEIPAANPEIREMLFPLWGNIIKQLTVA